MSGSEKVEKVKKEGKVGRTNFRTALQVSSEGGYTHHKKPTLEVVTKQTVPCLR